MHSTRLKASEHTAGDVSQMRRSRTEPEVPRKERSEECKYANCKMLAFRYSGGYLFPVSASSPHLAQDRHCTGGQPIGRERQLLEPCEPSGRRDVRRQVSGEAVVVEVELQEPRESGEERDVGAGEVVEGDVENLRV
jgi:hypothetical protein